MSELPLHTILDTNNHWSAARIVIIGLDGRDNHRFP